MDRAALFDIDGTLVDTGCPHLAVWWEAFGHRTSGAGPAEPRGTS